MSANYRNPQWLLPNCKNLKLPGTGTSVSSGLTEDRHSLYSMDFDGSAHIDTGYTFTSLTSFSISAWFKSDDTATAAQAIVSSRINSIGSSQGLDLNISSDFLFARIYNNGATQVTTAFTDTAGWHHVAMTYNGTTLEMYLDGVSKGTATGVYTNSAANWLIGKWNAGANYFNGKIDEVAIFNTALTLSEVQALSTASAPANIMALDKKPVAYYPLGEQARVGGDANPNAGGSEWQFPNEVLQSQVFDFDGTNDYVTASGVTMLNGLNTMSFSLWVKAASGAQADNYASILNIADSTTTEGQIIFSQNNTSNNFNFYVRTSAGYGTPATTGTGFLNGNWRHVVGTYDGNNLKLYLDGAQVSNVSRTGNLITATGELNLGVSYDTINNFFNGNISNVAIWDTDQSANIANIYNNGAPQSSYTVTPTVWYKLNAATSSYDFSTSTWTITDSAGSNNGTSTTLPSTALVSSDLQFESPYSNFSLNFDGTGNKVDFGDSDVFSFGDGVTDSPLSFSVWINLATLGAPHCVINKQTSSSNGEYKIYISTAGKIYIELANNGGEANGARGIQSGTNLSIDQWYHLAFTYDGRGGSSAYDGMNLYINGSLDSSTDWSYLSYTAMNNTNADFILGDLITGGSNTYDFNGNLDEAAIFNKALTQAEVSQIYNNGYAADLTSLSPVSWWRLGEDAYFVNNFITVPNQISGAPNGTGAGTQTSILVADAPGSYASGAGTNLAVEDRKGDAPESTANSLSFNMIPTNRVSYPAGYTPTQADNVYSMAFDGVNDYFDLNDNNIINGFTSVSFSFWVNITTLGSYDGILCSRNGIDYILIYIDNVSGSNFKINIQQNSTSGGSYTLTTSSTLTSGNWYNVICAGTVGGKWDLYINGDNSGQVQGSNNITAITQSADFLIGSDGLTAGRYLNGLIDEVAIFDYVLSERQIKQDIYEGTTTGKTADLNNISNLKAPVAWYRMGD